MSPDDTIRLAELKEERAMKVLGMIDRAVWFFCGVMMGIGWGIAAGIEMFSRIAKTLESMTP